MKRRSFLKLSGTTAMAMTIAPSLITQRLYAENGNLFQTFEKVQLKDASGNPIKATNLVTEENYLFHYPYVSTPAIMVNLPTATQKDIKLKAEDGTEYIYRGGAGSKGTLVAYSAICPHQLTYPQKSMSMFQYVDEKGKTIAYKTGGVFVCSTHLSAFEPKEGGKLVAGPAPEGLASILLEIDKEDNIWAVAVLGPVKFHDFFDAYKKELKVEYGRRGAKKLVLKEVKVQALKNFSAEIIQV